MRVLLIKTSSMGDIIHTLPALTDASRALPDIHFDWMVEESFAEIPAWHPRVSAVIPVSLRHWRKKLCSRATWRSLAALRQRLHNEHYDLILDAQGLMKSAVLTFFASGTRVGLDIRSAREGIASFAYQRKCQVDFYQHAIIRMRTLFSQALQYTLPDSAPDFSLHAEQLRTADDNQQKYLVFLHGTTWTTKEWPEEYWVALAQLAAAAGYRIKMSGGSPHELERVKRIAKLSDAVDVLPRLTIGTMARLLANATAAVAVDTGFGHLAAALNVPTVSLYGPTNPVYTGALGNHSLHLAAPFPCAPCLQRTCTYRKASAAKPACYTTLAPNHVWQTVQSLL